MSKDRVKDLMIPLSEYPLVTRGTSLANAIGTLKNIQRRYLSTAHPPRALLVIDDEEKIIGQLDYMDILRALEPRYSLLGDLHLLSRAGVSDHLVASLVDNLRFWEGGLDDVCRRATGMRVGDLMHPLAESIDEGAPLTEAIHKIVMWQTGRALVTSSGRVVGVLRLADLITEVSDRIEAVRTSE